MNAHVLKFAQTEREGRAIDAMRAEIATEILYRSCTARDRTVLADAFVDETIDRVIEAHVRTDLEPLSAWLGGVLNGTMPTPGLTVVLDTCAVLEAILEREGVGHERLRAHLRSVAALAAKCVRAESVEEPRSIDETDARINDLIATLENADLLTAEHSRAVASWCTRLARKLGLSESDVTLLTRCGLLHDIGKLKVPREVLNAPRALNAAEWKIIRAHAAAGESLAKKEPLLRETLPAIRSHHERFDGGGYPDDLRGEGIPFIARVVSVADCFNAMIGRRPYRPPLTPSYALEELRSNRGLQFDPDVVDAMEEVIVRGR